MPHVLTAMGPPCLVDGLMRIVKLITATAAIGVMDKGMKFLRRGMATLALLASSVLASPANFGIFWASDYAQHPLDFSVSSEYAYVVFQSRPPDNQSPGHRENGDITLVIYRLGSGSEVSRVTLSSLWEDIGSQPTPNPPRVSTVAYTGGVIIHADRLGSGAFLAHVEPGGDVVLHRNYESATVISLGHYLDFTMVHTNKGITILNEQLEEVHEWTAPEPFVLVAEPHENSIFVLSGQMAEDPNGMHRLSGSIRRLTLDGQLVEKSSFALPTTFFYHPMPRVIVWPNQLSVFVHDGSQLRNCTLRNGEGAFTCMVVAWQHDVRALHKLLAWSVYDNIVRSGEDGYIVAVENGCAIWSRRYDLSHAISRYQPSLPRGSSSLGIVSGLIAKEQEGRLFALMSSSQTSSGDDRSQRTLFGAVDVIESVPARTTPNIDGCLGWSDIGLDHPVTADEVKACVKKGVDPNAFGNCGAWTRPLSVAARLADSDALRALLEAGADPNAQDENGDTALHDAARYGKSPEKLDVLLEGGSSPTLHNNAGKLPLDYARENEALLGSSVLERLARESRDGD